MNQWAFLQMPKMALTRARSYCIVVDGSGTPQQIIFVGTSSIPVRRMPRSNAQTLCADQCLFRYIYEGLDALASKQEHSELETYPTRVPLPYSFALGMNKYNKYYSTE